MKSYSKQSLPEKRKVVLETKNSPKEIKQIWNINPSFKHIKSTYAIGRMVFLVIVVGFFTISGYLLTNDLFLSFGISGIILVGFLFVFRDSVYILNQISSFSHKGVKIVNPFQNLLFLFDKKASSSLYISNNKDLVHTGIKIFKIEVIPENIHASVNLFIKALSEYKNMVSFTYQVIQIPSLLQDQNQESNSVETHIYFCIYYSVTGILSRNKLKSLYNKMQSLENIMTSNLVGNFHHFKISHLKGIELIDAIRTFLFKIPSLEKPNELSSIRRRVLAPNFLTKLLFCAILLGTIDILLILFEIYPLIILSVNLGFFISLIFLWWREMIYFTFNSSIFRDSYLDVIDPFSDVKFFQIGGINDSLYAYVAEKLLVGIKLFNLAFIRPHSYLRMDKFIHGIMNQKISFGYTCINSPVSFEMFYKKYFPYLTLKTRRSLSQSRWKIETKIDEINWLAMRSGIWKTFLILSAYDFEYIDTLSKLAIINFEEKLCLKAQQLYNAFNVNYFNFDLIQLRNRALFSGLISTMVKNKNFTFGGTHLNYLIIQGKLLIYLTEIADELKKGITTRIASEFNTPLKLDNKIIIGDTINTEVLKEETRFGFTEEQLHNILVVNGISSSRELLSMKIVSQLVRNNIPSIIFDFRGDWSRLLRYFQGSSFEDEFLYFKLGTAFSLDPLKSDIPYDKENIHFLNYMFEAYALIFKKDQKIIEMMRNAIRKNPGLDMPSYNLELINQNKWEKSAATDTLLALFADLNQQDLSYFHLSDIKENQGVITFKDFINCQKTIIIDLSASNDIKKQIFFTFLILSKIIHYIQSHRNYTKKLLIIPHIDIIFNREFIDRKSDYGKINKFLDPLIEKGFGLFFSANQIHYLHPNAISYFDNIISFKTTDKRDIASVSSIMNLQELEGTGYYSRSRNQTYQIKYLMSLQKNEAIVKRSDIYQAFPVSFNWEKISNSTLMKDNEITTYMDKQGYNLRDTERRILDQIKKTLFEKDLGTYVGFIPEAKKFLESLAIIDDVGNLFEKKIKKELKKIIYPKASRYFNEKTEIKRCIDDIFHILIKHGYLVENHPKMASGSESLRTSYSVGPQFQKALQDEVESKSQYIVETIDSESTPPFSFLKEREHLKSRSFIIEEGNLKKAFMREFSNFNFEVFTAYEYIQNGDFKNALKLEHDLIHRFLIEVYKLYANSDDAVSGEDLYEFIVQLTKNSKLPFSLEQLQTFLDHHKRIEFEHDDLESTSIALYQDIFNFFSRLQSYIFNENQEEQIEF
jgi:hypothetical protein